MKRKQSIAIAVVTSWSILLMFAGCLDRSEQIVVDEQGNTSIRVEIKGDAGDFAEPMALPSEPGWEITHHNIDSSDADRIQVRLIAEREIPYGSDLPTNFLTGVPAIERLNLEFPTSIRVWKEGNRTFYEFKRSYVGRTHRCYYLSETPFWDQELEKRVIENGIFDVSEQDRNGYLDQFITGFAYYNFRFLWTVLGTMTLENDLSIEQMQSIKTRAADFLDARITPVVVLGLLGKHDDSIEVALEQFELELHGNITRIVGDVVGDGSRRIMERYNQLFDEETARQDLTERFSGQNFEVSLRLPGVLIETNGYLDIEKEGAVEWQFRGEDFQDVELTMHALSVVEH